MWNVLAYYGYVDESYYLLKQLNKESSNFLEEHKSEMIKVGTKRELKCHYPLFERVVQTLTKRYRYGLYKIRFQVKFPKDFKILNQFLQDYPETEFSHLHLVITEESLVDANAVIDTMRNIGMISQQYDHTYQFLD